MKKISFIMTMLMLGISVVACGSSDEAAKSNVDVEAPSGYVIESTEGENANPDEVIINAESANVNDYFRITKYDDEAKLDEIMKNSKQMNLGNNVKDIEEFEKGDFTWTGFSLVSDGVKGLLLKGAPKSGKTFYQLTIWGHELDSDEVSQVLESVGK